MQIQTIEQKTGLDRATIRYYEQEGLITPRRLQNGYRDYSDKQLQDLQKIKLLRQLGLSVETIRELIDGKDSLQSVLGNQLVVLKDYKTQVDNAETICKMMMQDEVTYENLKPSKYFIKTHDTKGIDSNADDTPYTEYVYLESHPFRRFVGRYLDQLLNSAVLMLVVVVLLRIRPFDDIGNSILSIAALLLSMPINALYLCLFGTTPGKFVVGIYLKTPEGKNMSYWSALQREWAVFCHGMGLNLPIYNLVRLYKSYQIHTAGRELEWDYDYDADVLYTEWDTKRGVFSAIFGIVCAIIISYSAVDAQLPTHRNADLTLAQFAENYNIYAKQNGMRNRLSKEGEWYIPGRNPNLQISNIEQLKDIVDGTNNTEHWQFITNDNQELVEISIKTSTNSRLFINEKMKLAIYTAILSQPDPDIFAADESDGALTELTFISELGFKEYNFGGVIVKTEIHLVEDVYDTTVNVIFP